MIKTEKKLLILSLCRDFLFVKAVSYWSKKIVINMIRRVGNVRGFNLYNYIYYPDYIKDELKRNLDCSYSQGFIKKLDNSTRLSMQFRDDKQDQNIVNQKYQSLSIE